MEEFSAPAITILQIQRTVANYYKIRMADLRGSKRHRAISMPRQIAMYLSRKHTGQSYSAIGWAFGRKHYSTAITAHRKIGRERAAKPYLDRVLTTLEQLLLSSATPATPEGE